MFLLVLGEAQPGPDRVSECRDPSSLPPRFHDLEAASELRTTESKTVLREEPSVWTWGSQVAFELAWRRGVFLWNQGRAEATACTGRGVDGPSSECRCLVRLRNPKSCVFVRQAPLPGRRDGPGRGPLMSHEGTQAIQCRQEESRKVLDACGDTSRLVVE